MASKQYEGPERRKYFRHNVIYAPQKRAKLKINKDQFDVLDFSQGGLRFLNDKPINIENRFRGELIFADGSSQEIKAEIVWELNKEVGINYL